MSTLNKLKKHLKPGQVYRRLQLAEYSASVDRHLQQLVNDGTLQKVSNGLYFYPKKSDFGLLPPEDEKLVKAFLKDDSFFIRSLNAYNSLGVGTTQLYNEKLVYNRKRDGKVELDGMKFYFIKSREYPKKPSLEFLLVDLVNNLDFLAEDKETLYDKVSKKVLSMDKTKLMRAVKSYGGARAKKFFASVIDNEKLAYGG